MILDIRFKDSGPMQYRHVRMTTVYALPEGKAEPEIVIHFYDNLYPQMNIALSRVISIMTTND